MNNPEFEKHYRYINIIYPTEPLRNKENASDEETSFPNNVFITKYVYVALLWPLRMGWLLVVGLYHDDYLYI